MDPTSELKATKKTVKIVTTQSYLENIGLVIRYFFR